MPRGNLTKAKIIEAALAVLDEAGLDGLTVRAVAARLDVRAPALYWHVRDKQALLDEMATEQWRRLSAELGALPEDTTWDAGMRAFAHATRRLLLAHRDGAKVFTGTYLTDPEVLRAQERPLARVVAQGFTLDDVMRGFMLLNSFVIGFCVEEQAVLQATRAGDDRYTLDQRAARVGEDAPHVRDAGPVIFGNADARFAELVEVLIAAIGRMRRD